MRVLARVVPLFLVLAVVSAAEAKTPKWTWASLHRPLHLPRVAPGARCPVTPMHRVAVGRNDRVNAPGRGPAYPLLYPNTTVPFVWPMTPAYIGYGTPWSGAKVMWVVAARYKGPVLVRGRQVDGTHVVRFDDPPTLERRLIGYTGGTSGARRYPSSTRIDGRAPGCYAYQVDGVGFSRVIVFRAAPYAPPKHDPPPP